jgi:uncharacterized protein (TIGR02246 family)
MPANSLLLGQPFRFLFDLALWIQIVAVVFLSVVSASTEELTSADELSIRKTISEIEVAWNTHDMIAYGDLLTEDVQWVNVVGMHWRGHKAVLDAHVAFHETCFKNHKIKTDSVEIRSLGKGIALAVVTTTNDEFKAPDGSVVPRRQNRQTYVLRASSNAWRIAHCHNVPIDTIAAKFDPVSATR